MHAHKRRDGGGSGVEESRDKDAFKKTLMNAHVLREHDTTRQLL